MIPEGYKFYVFLFRKLPFESYIYGLDCVPASWVRLRDVRNHRVGISYPLGRPHVTAMLVQEEAPFSNEWLVYDADVIRGTNNYDNAVRHSKIRLNLQLQQNPIEEMRNDGAESISTEKRLPLKKRLPLNKQGNLKNIEGNNTKNYTSNSAPKQIPEPDKYFHTNQLIKLATQVTKTDSANDLTKPTDIFIESHETLQKQQPPTHGVGHSNEKIHKDKSSANCVIKSHETFQKQQPPALGVGHSNVKIHKDKSSANCVIKSHETFQEKQPPAHGVGHSNVKIHKDKSSVNCVIKSHETFQKQQPPAQGVGHSNVKILKDKSSANCVIKSRETFQKQQPPAHGVGNSNEKIHKDKSCVNCVISDSSLRSCKQHESAAENNVIQQNNKSVNASESEEPTWTNIRGRLTIFSQEINQQCLLLNKSSVRFMKVNRFTRELLKLITDFNYCQNYFDSASVRKESLSMGIKKVVKTNIDQTKLKINNKIVNFAKLITDFFDELMKLVNESNQIATTSKAKKRLYAEIDNILHFVTNRDMNRESHQFTEKNSKDRNDDEENFNPKFLIALQRDLEEFCEVNDQLVCVFNNTSLSFVELLSFCHKSLVLLNNFQQMYLENETTQRDTTFAKEKKAILNKLKKYSYQFSNQNKIFSNAFDMFFARTLSAVKKVSKFCSSNETHS